MGHRTAFRRLLRNRILRLAATAGSLAAAAAVFAPLGQAQATAITAPPGWVFVTDDLGVPWLYPSTVAPRQAAAGPRAEASAAGATDSSATTGPTASPFTGWVFVNDDQGVPWLYPAPSR
jgi:hypothetical protein